MFSRATQTWGPSIVTTTSYLESSREPSRTIPGWRSWFYLIIGSRHWTTMLLLVSRFCLLGERGRIGSIMVVKAGLRSRSHGVEGFLSGFGIKEVTRLQIPACSAKKATETLQCKKISNLCIIFFFLVSCDMNIFSARIELFVCTITIALRSTVKNISQTALKMIYGMQNRTEKNVTQSSGRDRVELVILRRSRFYYNHAALGIMEKILELHC